MATDGIEDAAVINPPAETRVFGRSVLALGTCKSNLQVRREASRDVHRQLKHYSLPVVLAVGYGVRSGRGTQFHRWATARLEEYVVKGFTMEAGKKPNPRGGTSSDAGSVAA